VLVLDEPTNDLDIETLELLEELLANYEGTLFLVSHDRAFLDNVVTQVIAFEGDGKLKEYVGGYEDWLRMKDFKGPDSKSASAPAVKAVVKTESPKPKSAKKLSFKETRELDEIQEAIKVLEREQVEVGAILSAGKMYRDDPKQAQKLQTRASAIEDELMTLMTRWEDLESR
jgi:ATP-binding cassette subfamily F protein uup